MLFGLRHAAALLYDALILVAIFFGITFICVGSLGHAIAPKTVWYQFVLLGFTVGYYGLSYCLGQQTIGQKAWRLQLKFLNNSPSRFQIIMRLTLYFPAALASIVYLKKPNYWLQKITKTKLDLLEA